MKKRGVLAKSRIWQEVPLLFYSDICQTFLDAHTVVDQWEERLVSELNTQFEADSQRNQILQEQLHSKDYQLRKCGDFISRIIQGGVPNEIMALKKARLPIKELLATSSTSVPTSASIYQIAISGRQLIELGTLETIEPENSQCSLFDESDFSKRPDSTHSSSSDSGITEEPPTLPPKRGKPETPPMPRETPPIPTPPPIFHQKSKSNPIVQSLSSVKQGLMNMANNRPPSAHQPVKKVDSSLSESSHSRISNPCVRLLLSIGRKGKGAGAFSRDSGVKEDAKLYNFFLSCKFSSITYQGKEP